MYVWQSLDIMAVQRIWKSKAREDPVRTERGQPSASQGARPQGTYPADILISDFQCPELRENKFL